MSDLLESELSNLSFNSAIIHVLQNILIRIANRTAKFVEGYARIFPAMLLQGFLRLFGQKRDLFFC